jgi:hypothetical protein
MDAPHEAGHDGEVQHDSLVVIALPRRVRGIVRAIHERRCVDASPSRGMTKKQCRSSHFVIARFIRAIHRLENVDAPDVKLVLGPRFARARGPGHDGMKNAPCEVIQR